MPLRIAELQKTETSYTTTLLTSAYRSLGGAITNAKGHDSGIWTTGKIPVGLRRAPEALERRFGKIGKTYPKLTFDKDRVVGYSDIEFVGRGHALFEMVIDRVLTQYGEALRSGAVFLDPDATVSFPSRRNTSANRSST